MIESLGPSLDILRGLLGNWWGVGISRQGRSVNKDPGCVCGGGGVIGGKQMAGGDYHEEKSQGLTARPRRRALGSAEVCRLEVDSVASSTPPVPGPPSSSCSLTNMETPRGGSLCPAMRALHIQSSWGVIGKV